MALISLDETITISFSVKDRHASAKWYESMLGFETLYHAGRSRLVGTPNEHRRCNNWPRRTHQAFTGQTVFPFLGSLNLDTARQKLEAGQSEV